MPVVRILFFSHGISPYGKGVQNNTWPQKMHILYVSPYVILITINQFTLASNAMEVY
jgi:hypothetical protein